MSERDRVIEHRPPSFVLLVAYVGIAIALTDVIYQPILNLVAPLRGAPTEDQVGGPASCREADRAGAAQLAALLERNRRGDAPMLERAVYTLNMARRQCLYLGDERGMEIYRWFSGWLDEQS